MALSFLRTLFLYIIVVTGMRIMGKRQIGEMQPSELVVAIMISDLATIPMQDVAIPLFSGVIPILTLIVMEIVLSWISLKNKNLIYNKARHTIFISARSVSRKSVFRGERARWQLPADGAVQSL